MDPKSNFDHTLNWKGILFELFDKDGLEHPVFETTPTSSTLKYRSRVVWIDAASGFQLQVIGAEVGSKKNAEKNAAEIAVEKVFRSANHSLIRRVIPSAIRSAAGSTSRNLYMTFLSPLLAQNDAQISMFKKASECNTIFTSMSRRDKVQVETMILSHFLARFPWKKVVVLVPKLSLVELRHEELSNYFVNLR